MRMHGMQRVDLAVSGREQPSCPPSVGAVQGGEMRLHPAKNAAGLRGFRASPLDRIRAKERFNPYTVALSTYLLATQV